MSDWQEVTKQNLCPICDHAEWCGVLDDGSAVNCRRLSNHPTYGNGVEKTDKSGGTYWNYRLIESDDKSWPEPQYSLADGGGKIAEPDTLNEVYSSLIHVLPFAINDKKCLLRRGMDGKQINDFHRRRGYRSLGRGRKKSARKLIEAGMEKHLPNVPGFFVRDNEHGRYWSIAGRGGMLIPVRDVQGRIVALKSRSSNGSPKLTYLTSKSKKRGGPGPGSPVHIPLFDGDTSTVRIAEGELKADIATMLSGTLTIGLPGVGSWSRAAKILTELKATAVLVAFDAGCRRNKSVAGYLHDLVFDLREKGFTVQLETWIEQDGKGIDDLLLAGKRPEVITGDEVFGAVNAIKDAAVKPVSTSTPSQAGNNGTTKRDWNKPDVTLPGHDIPINYTAVEGHDHE